MIRKLTSVLLSFVVLSCMIFSASAQEPSRIVDDAGLLLPEEVSCLEEYSAQLHDYYGIDAVVLTVDSLQGEAAQDLADNFYDNSGYSDNGVLFLLAMSEREWYISTTGTVRYALTDYGIQKVGDTALPYLGEAMWFEGFYSYLAALPEFLDAYEAGSPIDGYADYSGDFYHADQEDILYYEEKSTPSFGLSLMCGIVGAAITILIMRSSMNTRRAQRGAGAYINNGSWKLTQHHDIFLYSNVTKTRKQDPNTSRGGGSSVHRSSGGRSHGGGGGKF